MKSRERNAHLARTESTRPRFHELLLNTTISLGSLALSLFVLEAILHQDFLVDKLRIYFQTHDIEGTDFFLLTGDPELPYLMRPSATFRSSWGVSYTTNEARFFGDTHSDGDLNLLITGDSVTFGLGVEQHETYPEILRTLLPEASIAIVAVPGYNTLNEVRATELFLSTTDFAPDFVVLQLGANDSLHPTKVIRRERYHFYQEIDTKTFRPPTGLYLTLLEKSHLFFMLNHELTRLAGGRARLYDYPDRTAQMTTELKMLLDLAERHEATAILLNVPYLDEHLPRFDALFEHFVDLGDLAEDEGAWFDRIHPNARGHALIAEDLFDCLEHLRPE